MRYHLRCARPPPISLHVSAHVIYPKTQEVSASIFRIRIHEATEAEGMNRFHSSSNAILFSTSSSLNMSNVTLLLRKKDVMKPLESSLAELRNV